MPKLSPDEQAAIDAFLATKQPTVVPTGQGANLTEQEWAKVVRTPGYVGLRTDADVQNRIDEDYEREAEQAQQRGVEENGYYKS